MTIQEILMHIQNELVAPKNLFNKFGNYNYRSAESILESVKPLLKKYNVILTVSDEIVNIGDRYYIKATARLIALDNSQPYEIETTAYAREDENIKGMSEAQVTGSTSSYARKYALNGLLAIDDTKDSDSTNTHGKEPTEALKDDTTEQLKRKVTNNLTNAARDTFDKHHGDSGDSLEVSDLKCSECEENISEKVKSFSTTKYGKALCMKCQKLQK